MGETKSSRKTVRAELDKKLTLSPPSRELLEQLAVACGEDPENQDATFQYAFALSRSQQASELRYAVSMLDSLVANGYKHQLDCMVGAATALYLLGDYEDARVRFTVVVLVVAMRDERNKQLTHSLFNHYLPPPTDSLRSHFAESTPVAHGQGITPGLVGCPRRKGDSQNETNRRRQCGCCRRYRCRGRCGEPLDEKTLRCAM